MDVQSALPASEAAPSYGYQETVNSLSIDEKATGHHHLTVSGGSQQSHQRSHLDRKKKRGLMDHFLRLTRMMNKQISAIIGSGSVVIKEGSTSATNSDLSIRSGQRAEAENSNGNEFKDRMNEGEKATLKPSFLGRHGFGHTRDSSGNGRSLLNPSFFNNRRGSLPINALEKASQSNCDTPELSSRERLCRRPPEQDPSNLRDRLGLHDDQPRSARVDEDQTKESKRFLQGISLKKEGSSAPALSSGSLSLDFHGDDPPGVGSHVDLDSLDLLQANNAKPTSRLGRLGRFKFPSLSMGSIHRNKAPTGLGHGIKEATPSNVRRGSLSALVLTPRSEPTVSTSKAEMHTPAIKGQGSVSTLASAHTTAMITLDETTPGSSSYSSISSNHHGLEMDSSMNIGKTCRQQLTELVDEHPHQPHHSSTFMGTMNVSPSMSLPSTHLAQGTALSGQELDPYHSSPQQYQRVVKGGIFGSEKFTSSTSGAHIQSIRRGIGHEHAQTQAVAGAMGSSSTKTSSRTVSVSHISSDSVFTASAVSESSGDATAQNQDSHSDEVKPVYNSNDIALQDVESLDGVFDHGWKLNNGEEANTGRYLFGDELKDMSFGEADAKAIAGSSLFRNSEEIGLESRSNSIPSAVRVSSATTDTRFYTYPPITQPAGEGSGRWDMKRKSDPLLRNSTKNRLPTITASPVAPGTTAYSEIIPSSDVAIKSASLQMLKDYTSATKPALANYSESSANHSVMLSKPSSPTVIENARGNQNHCPAPSFSSSSSPIPPMPILYMATPVRPKSSMVSSSAEHTTFGPYVPNRPPFNHSYTPAASSMIATSALNLATSVLGKHEVTSMPYPGMGMRTSSELRLRNPDIPHLEPRSAVADYTPIIHYKRQRSMSLQDADLLTADQFIALMPEDSPQKRRFSSEEALPDNPWHSDIKRRTGPLPDPVTTLRELLDELKSKCRLIMKHLDAVSASIPDYITATVAPELKTEVEQEILEQSGTNNGMEVERNCFFNEEEAKRSNVFPFRSSDGLMSYSLPNLVSASCPVPRMDSSAQQWRGDSRDLKAQKEDYDYAEGCSSETISCDVEVPSILSTKLENEQVPAACSDVAAAKEDVAVEEPTVISQSSLDSITALFDEMDHTTSRMVDIMGKYVSTDQFSNLTKELDEMCFMTQEIFRAELDRRGRLSEKASKSLEAASHSSPKELKRWNDSQSELAEFQDSGSQDDEPITFIEAIMGRKSAHSETRSSSLNRVDPRPKEHMRHPQRDSSYHKHQYRYQSPHCKPEEFGESSKMTQGERQVAVKDYVKAILFAAGDSVAEFMQVYNRMFVLPTQGYKIEGCNDLKTIESLLRPDPEPTKTRPTVVTIVPDPPQSPLLSRATAMQRNVEANISKPASASTEYIDKGADVGTTLEGYSDILSNTMRTLPAGPTSANSLSGQIVGHLKNLPESKVEWAALQKRREMGDSAGVAGAISMGNPTVTGGKDEGSGPAGGGSSGSNLSMLGNYAKEHMGHEAYYYRNWFLGKEHRTFVGQVDGLGTVIISIIKDMAVSTEPRSNVSGRLNVYPTSSSLPASGLSISSSAHTANFTHTGHANRPELVHSAHSFQPGRGSSLYHHRHSGSGSGGSLIPNPRSSSEAMRIILSASTAVVHGATGALESHTSGISGSSANNTSKSTANNHLSAGSHSSSSVSTPTSLQPGGSAGSTHGTHSNAPPRWQYRCILRQKDVDSIRITLPEPDPGPLNNLARRVGKPQWKTILQSIHPAITQQVASKLKKVQTNLHFEKELAKFDETMLRFNYKFGVLLVHPGQTKEEDWFSNQMNSSTRFKEFLQSGALGRKVSLNGFEGFSAGLDTRSDAGEYSYYDTWGEGFEIMYHVSTLLPFKTGDRQQIQRKRHIGNDIVCIIFVDGEQPFVPNAIKSQFLHIFVVIHPVKLSNGTIGYSAAIASDEQVPDFGPPLPDPPIFKTPQELRAFLLCKMINGENAAYKAPRLIKPHQRARSGMLEDLVVKANCLTKEKDSDKKLVKQQKTTAIAANSHMTSTPSGTSTSGPINPPLGQTSTALPCQSQIHTKAPVTPSTFMGDKQHHPHDIGQKTANGNTPGSRTASRNSLPLVDSDTAVPAASSATFFRIRKKNSNADISQSPEASFPPGIMLEKEKGRHDYAYASGSDQLRLSATRSSQDTITFDPGHIENLILSTSPHSLPSPTLECMPVIPGLSDEQQYFDAAMLGSSEAPEDPTRVTAAGQLLKFKEGYSFRSKAPMQIDTTVATAAVPSLANRNSYPLYNTHHRSSQTLSATAVSSSSSSSSPFTASSSLPSALLRSDTGASSTLDSGSYKPPKSLSSAGSSISPHPLREVPSRDAFGKNSLAVDCEPSNSVAMSGVDRSSMNTAATSAATTLPLMMPLLLGRGVIPGYPPGIVDPSGQGEWRFSESPSVYTPVSLPPMDSTSSLGSAFVLDSIAPASAHSGAVGSTSSTAGLKTDYMNFKPIGPSKELLQRQQQQQQQMMMSMGSGPIMTPRTASTSTFAGTPEVIMPVEELSIHESHSQTTTRGGGDGEGDPVLVSSTFSSIPSSGFVNTIVADSVGDNSDLALEKEEIILVEAEGGLTKGLRRAVSEESFLGQEGVVARIVSIHDTKDTDIDKTSNMAQEQGIQDGDESENQVMETTVVFEVPSSSTICSDSKSPRHFQDASSSFKRQQHGMLGSQHMYHPSSASVEMEELSVEQP
ncbi:Rap1 GTPase-activating protein 1 [Mortierella claussenii]|nr:Rap1 GTPase-activating protein 1 [Mortierella claussenii]